MKITVLTLFPDYFRSLLETSIIKRARDKELFEFECIDFRAFTKEKHGHVDDTPYGGGAVWCDVSADFGCFGQCTNPKKYGDSFNTTGKDFLSIRLPKRLSLQEHLIFICWTL